MEILAKLTLIFAAVGALAGVISGFMPNSWLALIIALILLYVTYKLASSSMKKSAMQPVSPEQQPRVQASEQMASSNPAQVTIQVATQQPPVKKKTILKGFLVLFATVVTKGEAGQKDTEVKFWFLQYYVMWLILWILTYTLFLLG